MALTVLFINCNNSLGVQNQVRSHENFWSENRIVLITPLPTIVVRSTLRACGMIKYYISKKHSRDLPCPYTGTNFPCRFRRYPLRIWEPYTCYHRDSHCYHSSTYSPSSFARWTTPVFRVFWNVDLPRIQSKRRQKIGVRKLICRYSKIDFNPYHRFMALVIYFQGFQS